MKLSCSKSRRPVEQNILDGCMCMKNCVKVPPTVWHKGGSVSHFSPVSQSQHKQLQEGRVYEQVLIVTLKLGEPGKPVSPASCGLHRDGEQPVEELDVFSI